MSPQEIFAFIQDASNLSRPATRLQAGNAKALTTILHNLETAYHAATKIDTKASGAKSEAPLADCSELKATIQARFPNLGVYAIIHPRAKPKSSPDILTSDAVDDIVEIVRDMLAVEWYWSNMSTDDGLRYFQWSYENHWGERLHGLQDYLEYWQLLSE